MTATSQPSDSGPRARLPRGRAFQVWLKGAILFLVAAASGLWYLEDRGLPESGRLRVQAALREVGFDLHFRRLRFSLRHGLTAHRAEWYLRPEDSQPWVRADRVRIIPDWPECLRGRWSLAGVEMIGASLFPSDPPAGAPVSPLIEGFDVRLEFTPAGVRVERLGAKLAGLEVAGEGTVILPLTLPGTRRPFASAGWRRRVCRQLAEIRTRVASLPLPSFEGGGRAEVEFFVQAGEAVEREFKLAARGTGGSWQGLRFGRWESEARFSGDRLEVERLSLELGTNRVSAAGWFDFARRELNLRAEGTCPAAVVLNGPLPAVAAERLERTALHTRAPVRFEVTTGTAPFATAFDRVQGRVEAGPLEVLDLPLASAASNVRREGSRWFFESVEGRMGGVLAGRLAGSGWIDYADRSFDLQATGACDPAVLLPVMNPVQSLHAGSCFFRSAAPEFDVRASGRIGDYRTLRIGGTARMRDFVYNGAYVAAASARFGATNAVLQLDDLLIERPEGRLTGRLEQRFDEGLIRFDIVSGLHPHALGRMAGPMPHRFSRKFRIEGPVRLRASGQVDYRGGGSNDVQADVEGSGIGFRWFATDEAAFHCSLKGRHVEVRDLRGRFHGGRFTGRADFDLPDAAEPRPRYAVEGRIDDADFSLLMQDLLGAGATNQSGRFDAELTLGGFMGLRQGSTATGRGRLAIRDGHLLEIPLFGPLSTFLDGISPGLGMAESSDFSCTFSLANCRVESEDAELQGGFLTLRGRGYYGFDERLRFAVEAKLLRKGLIADAVRLLTFPLTKLLEFDLIGTVRQPEWRPHNLPEMLF